VTAGLAVGGLTHQEDEWTVDFSDALRAMQAGRKVRRIGWNTDPGITPGNAGNTMEIASMTIENGGAAQVLRQIMVRRTDGSMLVFGGSQWDMLSDDWELAG
jgi:hypothetical protein